jgi:hypothetical protein
VWSQIPRVLVICIASVASVACDGDRGGPKGSDNTVAASVAPTGTVSVYLNKAQSISITFGTSDGRSASALRLSGGLASLPAGWTGPAGGFECPVVGTDAACALALQYLPTAPTTGSFALGFSYRANNGAAKQGSVTIDYSGLSPTLELLAGELGGPGNLDGPATEASFGYPSDVAVDASGSAYVVDMQNNIIRKIAPDGMVSTLAGARDAQGSQDGAGPGAQFYWPHSIAVGADGMIYVTDKVNRTIRGITPGGSTYTVAGGIEGTSDGTGGSAQFVSPMYLAADVGGNLYVTDGRRIRKVTPRANR